MLTGFINCTRVGRNNAKYMHTYAYRITIETFTTIHDRLHLRYFNAVQWFVLFSPFVLLIQAKCYN